ncbi:MAG TPA: sugar ABC transporter permease [Armatimonadota bacterium]|jgi:multiple sugar transport system permease protein
MATLTHTPIRRKKRIRLPAGFLFIVPSLVHLIVFLVIPIFFALYLSFHKWDVLKPNKPFIGMANYERVAADPYFWNAMWNSARYALFSVPLGMAAALAVAILVNQKLKGVQIFRTIYYLPAISSGAAISMVWMWVYWPERGLMSWALNALRVPGGGQVDWLNDPHWAMPALILMSIWTALGPRMILYLAGLQGIPAALYEAAEVDGAGKWGAFKSITLPLLMPTTLFVLVTSSIGAFQVFTPVYMMTKGGPLRTTDVVGYHIYTEAWRQFRMGRASAQSYVLFLVILAVTIIQFKLVNRRMEDYGG